MVTREYWTVIMLSCIDDNADAHYQNFECLQFMDSASEGVLLVSFGSVLQGSQVCCFLLSPKTNIFFVTVLYYIWAFLTTSFYMVDFFLSSIKTILMGRFPKTSWQLFSKHSGDWRRKFCSNGKPTTCQVSSIFNLMRHFELHLHLFLHQESLPMSFSKVSYLSR